jgi:predicted nucleic acid-binding protein
MPKTIISDTSCLIVLSGIGELGLLYVLYGGILATPEIAEEFGEPLPTWVDVRPVHDRVRQRILETQLDLGESSALALALETPKSLLILDDAKARKLAAQLNLEYTGTLGVIVKAKQKGHLPLVAPLLDKMKRRGFYLSTETEQQALAAAGE